MTMIEKVAKTIEYEATKKDSDWSLVAKAAIKAMCEPTDEMIKAAYPMSSYVNFMTAYKHMIDAALEEK